MDTLTLPARIESLTPLRDFVFQKLSKEKAPEALFPKVELILEEVLTNVFFYAYGRDGEGDVELGCELQAGMLRLRIADRGKPFNPLESPQPDLSDDIDKRSVGGLGIFFVREMVDSSAYERRSGRNELTLSIKIH